MRPASSSTVDSVLRSGLAPTMSPGGGGFAPGEAVGPWRIEHELGRGGMSTVYAVVHTEIGKRAALKVVHHHVISASFTPARVLLEAQLVNRIAHGSIVDIFENGVLPDGRPYLIMERLEGWSLGQRQMASRITADEVIAILLQLCDVLTATHAAGIVHCDLKPENVFLVDGPAGPRRRGANWHHLAAGRPAR